jgi:hypothetical protein
MINLTRITGSPSPPMPSRTARSGGSSRRQNSPGWYRGTSGTTAMCSATTWEKRVSAATTAAARAPSDLR